MAPLTSPERRALKARAHAIRPVVMISEAGLSARVLAEIGRSLTAHELIKIRVLGAAREQRQALLAEICAHSGAQPVQHIGRMLVIWRPNPPAEESPAPAAKPARRAPPQRAPAARRRAR